MISMENKNSKIEENDEAGADNEMYFIGWGRSFKVLEDELSPVLSRFPSSDDSQSRKADNASSDNISADKRGKPTEDVGTKPLKPARLFQTRKDGGDGCTGAVGTVGVGTGGIKTRRHAFADVLMRSEIPEGASPGDGDLDDGSDEGAVAGSDPASPGSDYGGDDDMAD